MSSPALLWWSSLVLACCIGFLSGIIADRALSTLAAPPRVIEGSTAMVGSVVLEGFRDGALRGQAAGPVRLFTQDEAVEVQPDGSFAIVHAGFRIEDVSVPVPAGMQFVASKKGKKYYTVTSAAGEKITPANRIYFPTAAAAEAAGFVR